MTSKVVAPRFNLHIPPRDLLPVHVVSTTPVNSASTSPQTLQTPAFKHHHHPQAQAHHSPNSASCAMFGGSGGPLSSVQHQCPATPFLWNMLPFADPSTPTGSGAAPCFVMSPPMQQRMESLEAEEEEKERCYEIRTNRNDAAKRFAARGGGSNNSISEEATSSLMEQHPTQSAWHTPTTFMPNAATTLATSPPPLSAKPQQPNTTPNEDSPLRPSTPRPFEASRVLPLLYLGSYFDADCAAELDRRNIRRIINIAKECAVSASVSEKLQCEKFQLRKYDISDHSDEHIASFFDDAARFIHEGIIKGEGVLVHCKQGVSRSATLVLCYLMYYGFTDFAHELTAIAAECGAFTSSPSASPLSPMVSDSFERTPPATQQPRRRRQFDGHDISAVETPCLLAGLRQGLAGCSCCKATGGMCYSAAFDFLKSHRPQVSPNLGFVLALHEIDRRRGLDTPDL